MKKRYFIQFKENKGLSIPKKITKNEAISYLLGYYNNTENVLKNSRKDFPINLCFCYIWKE